VVPACGSCLQLQSRSRGVKESKSWKPRADRVPRVASGRKVAEGSQAGRLGRASRGPQARRSALHQNRRNKPRMSMKTKDRLGNQPPLTLPYPRRGILDSPPRMRRAWGRWDFEAWRETGFMITKTAEQSQNVYENKGQVQKVGDCRMVDGIPTISGRRPEGSTRLLSVSSAKSMEQSENVYENKAQVQKVAESASADRRLCGLRLFRGSGRAADRKDGGPRYTKSMEQSQNVYEKKGQVQKVA